MIMEDGKHKNWSEDSHEKMERCVGDTAGRARRNDGDESSEF